MNAPPPRPDTPLAVAFDAHRHRLFGLCYRITGTHADADELVQETFVRALERPPADPSRPWGPWLTRVAANLAKDRLRHRKASPYVGPWLPEPLRTQGGLGVLEQRAMETATGAAPSPEARYTLRESTTLVFLHALETLSPQARAVLVLRDVYGQSTKECADALSLSEANTKVILHRARKQMATYDERQLGDPTTRTARTQEALSRLLMALASNDDNAMKAILHEEVEMLNDGAGEFFAARKPVRGRDAVMTFFRRTKPNETLQIQPAELNGLPALLSEYAPDKPGNPPRSAFHLEVDASGRITHVYLVVCSTKLQRYFPSLQAE